VTISEVSFRASVWPSISNLAARATSAKVLFEADAWTRRLPACAFFADGIAGVSTISQQLAKNLPLTPSKILWRKAQEAASTLMLELPWDNRRAWQ